MSKPFIVTMKGRRALSRYLNIHWHRISVRAQTVKSSEWYCIRHSVDQVLFVSCHSPSLKPVDVCVYACLMSVFGKLVYIPAVLGMRRATVGQEWRKKCMNRVRERRRMVGGSGRISVVEFLSSDSFCFWTTIVWCLVDPPSTFVFIHFIHQPPSPQ